MSHGTIIRQLHLALGRRDAASADHGRIAISAPFSPFYAGLWRRDVGDISRMER